jgi:acetyl-CoA carboxylase biotin carboxyl carrier protein
MDIRKVKKLIELLEESGIDELEIHEGEESVRISRHSKTRLQQQPSMRSTKCRAHLQPLRPQHQPPMPRLPHQPKLNGTRSPLTDGRHLLPHPSPSRPTSLKWARA